MSSSSAIPCIVIVVIVVSLAGLPCDSRHPPVVRWSSPSVVQVNGRGGGGEGGGGGRRRLSLALAVPLHPRRPSLTSSLSSSPSGGGLVGCLSSVTSVVARGRRARWASARASSSSVPHVLAPSSVVRRGRRSRWARASASAFEANGKGRGGKASSLSVPHVLASSASSSPMGHLACGGVVVVVWWGLRQSSVIRHIRRHCLSSHGIRARWARARVRV